MFKNFEEGFGWLGSEMPKTGKQVFKDGDSFKRGQHLLEKLGSPHLKLKFIHVAGTSGKGGAASYTAATLREQGFKVGLNLSPYAKVFGERIQINSQNISDEDLLSLINQVKPVVDEMSQSDFGRPSYFEVITAMSLFHFYQSKVDYAVIEVGLGGTFDTTNLIQPEGKICIINKIDFDHTKILGDKLEQIASHKAGIIQKNNAVVALSQKPEVNEVIKKRVAKMKAKLNWLTAQNIKDISISINGTEFKFKDHQFKLKMIGAHNAYNFGLSLMAVEALAKQDGWQFDIEKTKVAQNLQLPFRFEIVKAGDKTIILDGAHNLDKLSAFKRASSFLKLKPEETAVIFGFKKSYDANEGFKLMSQLANYIVVSKFSLDESDLSGRVPMDIDDIKDIDSYKIKIDSVGSPAKAWLILKESKFKNIIVTGSFFLCYQFMYAVEKA
jgi:dihydrofolate synthase/folylpolyglutamate synthase